MTTIGDGFLIAFTIFGLFITAWATSVSIMLLFPKTSDQARVAVTSSPGRTIGLGILLLLTFGAVGIVALGSPLPLAKLAGWVLILALLAVAAVGTSGISQAAGVRLRELDESLSPSQAMTRGAAFIVGATILPILGWLFFGPILLFASLGAGWKALRPLEIRRRDPGVV